MTCRDDILAAIADHERATGQATFTILDVLGRMTGSPYTESTIRTHIVSVMCSDAPKNHGTVYDDLERLERGVYRLRPVGQSRPPR
jgi:hypothetical protein